jgi:hypothetical protein
MQIEEVSEILDALQVCPHMPFDAATLARTVEEVDRALVQLEVEYERAPEPLKRVWRPRIAQVRKIRATLQAMQKQQEATEQAAAATKH